MLVNGTTNTIGGTPLAPPMSLDLTPPAFRSRANDNLVIGNFVGTDSSGDNFGNATGVSVSATGNTIGGTGGRVRQHDRLQHTLGGFDLLADNLIVGQFYRNNSIRV